MKLTDLKIPSPLVNAFVCGFAFMRFMVALKDTPVIPLLTRRERRPSLQVSLIHPPQKCQRRPVRPSACLWWRNAELMKCPLSCHSHLSHIYFTICFVLFCTCTLRESRWQRWRFLNLVFFLSWAVAQLSQSLKVPPSLLRRKDHETIWHLIVSLSRASEAEMNVQTGFILLRGCLWHTDPLHVFLVIFFWIYSLWLFDLGADGTVLVQSYIWYYGLMFSPTAKIKRFSISVQGYMLFNTFFKMRNIKTWYNEKNITINLKLVYAFLKQAGCNLCQVICQAIRNL